METATFLQLAENIRNWRQRRGLSASALARAADVSKSTVSEIERGRGNPSLDTLWALARGLNVPLGFLVAGEPCRRSLRVVRRDEVPPVVHSTNGYISQLMLSAHSGGEIEIYAISLAEGTERISLGHGAGVTEHAIAVAGRVEIGPVSDIITLETGDLASFPANSQHVYRAVSGPASIISLHQYPPTTPGIADPGR